MRRVIIAVMFGLAGAGCGSDGPQKSSDYGNILNSPADLILVQEEHQAGWTRPDCFTCHPSSSIHQVNRTGVADIDLAQIQAIVQNQGLQSCPSCHGWNGVPTPVPTPTPTPSVPEAAS